MILVLSDVHIGRRGASWGKAIELMKDPRWNEIIVCGDFFDLWYKPTAVLTLALLMLALKDVSRKITYIVGNHDEDVDDLIPMKTIFRDVRSRSFRIIGGKRFVFVHGHETDFFNSKVPWIGHFLTLIQAFIHRVFKIDTHSAVSALIEKLRVRRQRKKLLEKYADTANILISGHTHAPGKWEYKTLKHYNAGDWVRNQSYLTIAPEGEVTMHFYRRENR